VARLLLGALATAIAADFRAARIPLFYWCDAGRDPNMKLGQDCCIVRDANGYPLAYVYFEDEPGRRSAAHLRRATRRGGSPSISPSCRRY
jgi:hypothetical protein